MVKRKMLQASEDFITKLKEIQKKVRLKTGNEAPSLTKLTDIIAKTNLINEVEKKILENDKNNVEMIIKFDWRGK